jgi:pimeloyl-ACP methyl ester carboxylesterase
MVSRPAGTPWCRRPARSNDPVSVLLLHGLGCRTTMWDRFAGLAGAELELWDVELPWHGVENERWSHSEDNVGQLVHAIGADDGFIGFDAVVAHSFSANLLLEAYARRLVVPRPSVLAGPFYRSTPNGFDWSTISYYLNDFHLIFAEALRMGDGQRYSPDDQELMARRLRDQLGPYGWTRFFDAYLRSPFLDLAAVDGPALVVVGDRDIAAGSDGAQALAASLPFGEFALIDHCGHFPMLERPERFARAVSDFLDTVPRHRMARAATDDPSLELA